MSLGRLPRYQVIAQNSAFQKLPSHRLGETPRSRQMSAIVRPTGRRRISASSCSRVGRLAGSGASSGSGRRSGAGRGGCGSAWGAGGAAGAVAARAPPAGLQEDEIAAARGTGEQHAFQRHGAQDAAGEAGEDRRDAGGAEELRDDGEAARGGAVFERCGQVAAVGEQDVEDGEDVGDVLRHGFFRPGPVGDRVGEKGRRWRPRRSWVVLITNLRWEVKGFFPQAGAWAEGPAVPAAERAA